MRVVDSTRFDPHGVPVKRRVTIRTPHLGTPADLENHGAALWTGLGVLLEKRDRLDIIWIAHVIIISFNLIAIRAYRILTNLTLPSSR